MKRKTVSLGLSLTMLALCAPFAWSSDSLNFFNNWFVTGDYAVAGVGLRGTGVNGWATGTIQMTGLPAGAEPIAAFLYWSTVETTSSPGAAIGYFNGNKIQGAVLGNPQNPNPPCWSSGGTNGPAGAKGLTYRADVLRYLPVDSNNIPQANGNQTVKLVDSGGNGNGNTPYTNGASLVVIYKLVVPGSPAVAPLRAVMIYNGAFSMDKHSQGMTQTVAGFYQASANADARITGLVANGQPGFSSPLSVNGNTLATSPFVGAQGVRWDNPSYNINLAANASSFSALATVGNNQTCLTWAAIVASVAVQDTDGDGLLDLWETKGLHRNTQVSPATFGTCSDYPAEPCVNLPAMGANPNKQDIFVQIDWMHGTGDGTGGTDGHGTHDHMPQLAALSSVAASFVIHGINVHFDVGGNYQGIQAACGNALCPFIVPTANAQGGTDIPESTLLCTNTTKHVCDYDEPYPVLSFEFGFASVRDGNHLLNIPGHFAQNRKDAFHYALFAHALAGPFNAAGQPVDPFTGNPTTTPLSYSGIAHRPGGGFMVTLGLWRSDIPAFDQVGSQQVQEGTLMHELGHNLGLGHAGTGTKPNCMPNYPSVMNYLYQTRGLTDPLGNEQIDYSNGWLNPLNEGSLSTSNLLGTALHPQYYKVRYYGPLAVNQPAAQAAQLHCDGTPLNGEAPEVRLEGSTVSTPDWSNGTVSLGTSSSLDVNYDGNPNQVFTDQADWLNLNLQQIGTGYSFGGLSVGAFATDGGAYATDGGALATDAGALATDGGAFATDGGAFATDGGAFATDGGAFATDGGAFATDGGAFATDAGDINQTTVLLSSVDPPAPVNANNTISSIVVSWTPPANGSNLSYNVYRCAGAGCTPSAPALTMVSGGGATPSFTDVVNDFADAGATCPATSTCYNTTYVYTVTTLVTVNSSRVESLFSKTASSEVTHLFVLGVVLPPPTGAGPGPSQTYVYGVTIPAPTYLVYGDVASNLTSGVTCAYSPANPRNVGTYQIVCSGPSPTLTSVTDGVTYNAAYISHISGVLTIAPRPITVTAAASTKVYDGTTSSQATPTITTGSLAYTDSVTWNETYDNQNVGTARVMTPSGTVMDLNGGNNYQISFVTISTGVIIAKPASVTPNAAGKTYGTPDPSPFTGTLSGFLVGDNVTATYSRLAGENAGTYTISATLAPTGVLGNYNITYNTALFTILPAPQSITFGTLSNQPLGIPDFQVNATASSGLPVSFTASGNCTVTPVGLVHLVATGSCTITASQAGGGNYLAAISVNQSFMITGGIDFTTLSLVGSPTNSVATATPTTLTMTSGTGQTSAAWLPAKQPVGNGFTTQFKFQISPYASAIIADGFAFVIQNGAAGTGALGTIGMGGFLGYQGLPNSIAIEFDTYQNGWDPNANHVAIQSNGTGPNSADHTTSALLSINAGIATNLSDGNVHTVIVKYDGSSTLTVFLDGAQVVSAPINLSSLGLDPGGNAVVGFTAATGSAAETTQISGWSFTSN